MLIAVVIGIGAVLLLTARVQQAERHAREARAWVGAVMDSIGATTRLPGPPIGPEGRDSVYWQWVATTAQLESRRAQEAVRSLSNRKSTLWSEADVASLRRQGLQDPARQLRDSLLAHPELIPYRDGPTWSFSADKLVMLEPPYAFAQCQNGRDAGVLLLQYRITEGPRVWWRRLYAERVE